MKRILLFAIVALFAAKATATDFTSHHLLVPIAGRTAGVLGTEWKTDLVVTNAKRNGEPVSVQIFFIDEGYINQPVVANLWPRQSANLVDVIGGTFGKQTATGLFLITTNEPDAQLTARARIYNTTASGQYGQTVQAIPLTKLSKSAVLTGLSGVDGKRTNVGIANPADVAANVSISLFDVNGDFHGSFTTAVGAYSVLRLNDVFSYFQAGPLDGATIQINSSHGVYPYASVVRRDTGDADFVAGAATEIDHTNDLVTPPCSSPATLSLAALPAGGYSVIYKPGIDPFVFTPILEGRHNFTAKHVYQFGVFYAEKLTQAQIAALRCESSIRVVEQNGYVPVF
jgi:hypothetical protein